MYMLDTNIIIYYFKRMGAVADILASKHPKDFSVSTIVLHELEVGIAKSNNPPKVKNQLDIFLSSINVLPFSAEDARAAASIRARLENQGMPIRPLDTLIAGAALNVNATLVTHNTKEFGRIEGLKIEDWF